MQDIIIVGAGIIGTAVARELSKYNLTITVLDKRSDISEGTSKANSGLIHSGHDCEPNTKKAKFNVRGNELYTKLCDDLEIPFRRNGALVLCFNEEEHYKIEKLYERAKINNVPDVSIIYKDEILDIEKNINDNVYSALYAKTAGIISPYEATIAFAENANRNGVEFKLNTEVLSIKKGDDTFEVTTDKGLLKSKILINASGLYSDEINNMLSNKKYKIVPRKGEYVLLDKTAKYLSDKTLFPLPTKLGKGILITPTVHDNILVGPSSLDIDDKKDITTTRIMLEHILKSGESTIKSIPVNKIITSFAGLRAGLDDEYDFVVEESNDVENLINTIGINSPGLSAAPAIAEYIGEIIFNKLKPIKKDNFIEKRSAIKMFSHLSEEEQERLVKENKDYGKIICRCESITLGEILESINRPLGATTIDGIKRRTRLSMGRCQGGFCTSKVIEILANELNVEVREITKFGQGSNILVRSE